jgi:hypothetical protein
MHFPRLTAIAVLSAALAACSNSTQSLPATAGASALSDPAGSAPLTLDAWHTAIGQNKLPSAGCFTANYPSLQWSRVACVTPPHIYYTPRTQHPQLGQSVGDENDFTIDTGKHIVSTATGSFPSVKGVKTVISGGEQGSYTLQLNSNFFQTSACGSISDCVGWSQFVFENPGPSSTLGYLWIQDWLVATKSYFTQCPPGQGWENLGIGCVQNSPYGVTPPALDVTDLASATVTGDADSSGDSVYMSVGKKAYGMKNVQGDGITDLSKHWAGAEFNIIGNGGGDEAIFNSGSKISVAIMADDGVKSAPKCPGDSGTTGETNNLFLVKAPAKAKSMQYPSIEFAMSSKQAGKATCDVEKAKG